MLFSLFDFGICSFAVPFLRRAGTRTGSGRAAGRRGPFSQREGTYFLFSAVRPSGESPEKGSADRFARLGHARVRHSVSGPVLRVACRVLCGGCSAVRALPGGASAVREMLRRHLSARLGFGRTAAKGVSAGRLTPLNVPPKGAGANAAAVREPVRGIRRLRSTAGVCRRADLSAPVVVAVPGIGRTIDMYHAHVLRRCHCLAPLAELLGGEGCGARGRSWAAVGVGELAVLACDAAAFAAYAVGLLLVERHFAAAFAYGLFVFAADDDHAPVAMVAGVAVLRLCGLLLCRGTGSDRHAYGGEGRENTLFIVVFV